MTSLPLILVYFTITSSCFSERDSWKCTLPPVPKNGYIKVIKADTHISDKYIFSNSKEIRQLKTYHLEFHCNVGFGHIGPNTQTCFEDGHTDYADFECFSLCASDSSTMLVSCGAEAQCIMAPKVLEAEPRLASAAFKECGVASWALVRNRREIKDDRQRASSGRSASSYEFPWHAGVYTRKTRPYMQICGGTVVSPAVVISAAHCFWSEEDKQLPASDYAVAVGKLYRPWNEPHDADAQKSDVSEIRIPLHFQGHVTNLQDDIALVIVKSPFTFNVYVRPVCLNFTVDMDQEHLSPGSLGMVAGWGLTSADGPAAPTLQVVSLPVLDISECFDQAEATFRAHITSDKFCAGWKNGTAVCRGDSGGGLFFSDWSRNVTRYFLRGIVSGAPQNEHLCNVYSWASFTRVQKHERFILDTLQEVETI